MITEISERPQREQDANCRSTARIDLVGEIKASAAGAAYFQRGITEYPMIGEPAMLMSDRELRLIYSGAGTKPSNIGALQQDPTIPAQVDIEQLVSKHFAVLGTTGVGKSNGVAILLQKILDERPDLRIFLIDPHNEYGRCFGDKAQVLTPRNLRLPFWLFNFEETVDAFFGGRPGVDEEVEILSEAIPRGQGRLRAAQGLQRPRADQEEGPAQHRLRRRHAGALPHRRPDHRDRRSDGQAREPLARDDLQQAAPAHQDVPQSPALRLHVRERHRRRRHHGRGGEPPVPHSERTASR